MQKNQHKGQRDSREPTAKSSTVQFRPHRTRTSRCAASRQRPGLQLAACPAQEIVDASNRVSLSQAAGTATTPKAGKSLDVYRLLRGRVRAAEGEVMSYVKGRLQ
ncbi:hypothetical protein SKAU_G00318610 [Synaphobranchus kaupii]|uniref:Uncharacterized protein n=1 Tax=Synaphobranchus kaupii TaxID=118154 RepID=A0A9Q1ILZ7_SYNKA|nr:hypothetical protein SKAU_G00318610 [Synaphobranchus kaupii]